jgi:hypothetical protein
VFITACSTGVSDSDIQTAIAETQMAQNTETYTPSAEPTATSEPTITSTPKPTNTPRPTRTHTPAPTFDQAAKVLEEVIYDAETGWVYSFPEVTFTKVYVNDVLGYDEALSDNTYVVI